jgi:glycosyltransferase involved in cell wall biosynthesis
LPGAAGVTAIATFRVCLITEIFHPEDQGGQGQHAFELAARLRARGVDVTVLTRRVFEATPRGESTGQGIRVVRLEPPGLLKGRGWHAVWPSLRFLSGVFFALVRGRASFDVFLVHGVKGILLPTVLAARLFGKRCVIKIDALEELENGVARESIERMGLAANSFVLRTWTRLRDALLRRADAVIAISSELADALRARGLTPTQVRRIPNGIDLRRWLDDRPGKAALRQRLSLPDQTLVTYAGRLSRAKGLVMLVKVWQRVAASYPHVHLLLIGSGDRSFDGCESELRALVQQAGLERRVTFVGHVDTVPDYLRASDLFVVCSESEGFGLSLIEAMAVGLPCISTAVGAAPEVIRHRESGWLIPVNDAHALHRALEDALHSHAQWPVLGAEGRRAVVERFDLDEVVERYLALFQTLVRTRAGRA